MHAMTHILLADLDQGVATAVAALEEQRTIAVTMNPAKQIACSVFGASTNVAVYGQR